MMSWVWVGASSFLLARSWMYHAIALALPSSMVKGGSAPVGPYLVPATAGNGDWPTGPILMGSKIGIPVGAARPAGLSSLGNMVFDAFQSYGAYVGDVCGAEAPIMPADGPSMGLAPGTGRTERRRPCHAPFHGGARPH